MTLSTRYLLRLMTVEEWRLHSCMFGGRRFALFPLFVAAVAAGTAAFFALANADAGLLVDGLHLVVAALGLQVGTVGLVGRDALDDLLGETALLLFSARTLPLEPRKLLVAFLVKDVGYYAVLFLSTHFVETAAEVCTQVGIINRGRLLEELRPRGMDGDALLDRFFTSVDEDVAEATLTRTS